ncbi:ATP-binding protein [Streptomyces cyaneofuscatus]|uniref:ATP-binding protein n=1 Tax=Streptomyces cyaneofuscatus TaxID=66883 RepID=UPI003CF558C6
MNASPAGLQQARELTGKTLCEAGVGGETSDNAALVVSELVGNAVRACGHHVPVVVEVDAEEHGVSVKVHDPEPERQPCRSDVPLDDREADSGRGLGLVQFFAPGWTVRPTPFGKQVVCLLSYDGTGGDGHVTAEQMPFRVEYDQGTRELVVWVPLGQGPQQITRRKHIGSLEVLAIAVAAHRHEAFLQRRLADSLVSAAVAHLGADPGRLETAVRELADPTSTVPLGTLLRGDSPGRAHPPAAAG